TMTQQLLAPGLPDVTRDDVEAISRDEPAWLRERRLEAWRLYESMDLPDPGDEEWRRTDVRALDLSDVKTLLTRMRIEEQERAELERARAQKQNGEAWLSMSPGRITADFTATGPYYLWQVNGFE